MTETIVGSEVVESLESAAVEPCEFAPHDSILCPNAAEWSVMVSCCGAVFLFCQEHFDELLEALHQYDGFWCNSCHAIVRPPSKMITAANKIRG